MWSKEKFLSDLEFGKIGEEKTLEYLYSRNFTQEVIDVRDDDFWRDNDVDFILICKDGDILKIETKTDRIAHKSKNLAYEVISNKHYNTQGCFAKTKCDVMMYYLQETDEMYYINMGALRDYIEENKKDLALKPMGDNALGYLLRMNKLLEKEIMFKA